MNTARERYHTLLGNEQLSVVASARLYALREDDGAMTAFSVVWGLAAEAWMSARRIHFTEDQLVAAISETFRELGDGLEPSKPVPTDWQFQLRIYPLVTPVPEGDAIHLGFCIPIDIWRGNEREHFDLAVDIHDRVVDGELESLTIRLRDMTADERATVQIRARDADRRKLRRIAKKVLMWSGLAAGAALLAALIFLAARYSQ